VPKERTSILLQWVFCKVIAYREFLGEAAGVRDPVSPCQEKILRAKSTLRAPITDHFLQPTDNPKVEKLMLMREQHVQLGLVLARSAW
jgi:hypothetical protein